MIAFHGDPSIKEKYLARVRHHRQIDALIQGTGWEDGKGCAVGCTLESYDHVRYEDELGIPVRLAHLEDRLFELIPVEDKATWQAWPERFLAAIRPGADLSQVWAQWAVWMLEDPEHGVINHAGGRTDVEAAIRQVAKLWREGGTPEQFREARRSAAAAYAAADADASAAAAAAYADAAYAAYAAAYAAASAAAYAAASAAAAYAYAAAYAWLKARAAWSATARDKLIALLEAA